MSARLTVPVFTSLQSSVVKMFWLLCRAAWIVSSSTAVEKTPAACCGAKTGRRVSNRVNGITVTSSISKSRKYSVALSRIARGMLCFHRENCSMAEPLMKDHPDERPPWWETTLLRDHPDERLSWWKIILITDHPDERAPWWESTLMRDHPDERPPWWQTTLMKDHPGERSPWWQITLMRDHPDDRPPWWKIILMWDQPDWRPPW